LTARAVITGIGCVSPVGIGGLDVAMLLADDSRKAPAFRVPDFPLEEHIGNARAFRRVAQATKFALAAVSLALRDAGLEIGPGDGARTAVILGVTHGAIDFSTQFFGGLLQDGPEAASPMLFSESVLNAPAGNVAIAFGIRGPVHTLVGEETVGAQALGMVPGLLQSGAVDRCVVAGTEEWGAIIGNAYRQMDRAAARSESGECPAQQGEGAAALVIESPEEAERRGARLRVPVLSCRCSRDPQGDLEGTVSDMVSGERKALGEGAGNISHLVLPTGRNRVPVTRAALRALEGVGGDIRRLDIAARIGNPFGAAAVFQMAVSAAFLSSGSATGAGLVLTSGFAGTCSAVFFGVPPDGNREKGR
jgi:3-oxoacyl-(acyl-carrier-protein) synthase